MPDETIRAGDIRLLSKGELRDRVRELLLAEELHVARIEQLEAALKRAPMPSRTFGGYRADEVADLCELHARAADHHEISYSETASISRRARDAIRFLLGMKVPEDA